MTANAGGVKVAELRYYPWGEVRYADDTTPTDYRFTGQRQETMGGEAGLYDYRARYYDPALGRFIQPDTIVPGTGEPQSLNRYSYARNSPVRYIDPTGHIEEDEVDDAESIVKDLAVYGVWIDFDWGYDEYGEWQAGFWKLEEIATVLQAVQDFASEAGLEGTRRAIGGARFRRIPWSRTRHCGGGVIELGDYTFEQSGEREEYGPRIAIVHELAHYWDWRTGGLAAMWTIGPGDLALGMEQFVGDEHGPTAWARTAGAQEAWAESAATFVYPQYRDILVAEADPSQNYACVSPQAMTNNCQALDPSTKSMSPFNSLP